MIAVIAFGVDVTQRSEEHVNVGITLPNLWTEGEKASNVRYYTLAGRALGLLAWRLNLAEAKALWVALQRFNREHIAGVHVDTISDTLLTVGEFVAVIPPVLTKLLVHELTRVLEGRVPVSK